MMKIHTTQNLNSPVINSTNNIVMPKNLRYSMYSSMSSNDSQDADTFKSTSFKGKKSALKKAVEAGKKTFAERVADKEGIKKLLNSDSFGKALEFTGEQEVMIQAGTALAICCGLRPLTIMAIPGDKNKLTFSLKNSDKSFENPSLKSSLFNLLQSNHKR